MLVSTASCYQPLKSHLFSLSFVVVAKSVLTPDPTELLFSSFDNCVYQVLRGWLFSPCQSSAILSPAGMYPGPSQLGASTAVTAQHRDAKPASEPEQPQHP